MFMLCFLVCYIRTRASLHKKCFPPRWSFRVPNSNKKKVKLGLFSKFIKPKHFVICKVIFFRNILWDSSYLKIIICDLFCMPATERLKFLSTMQNKSFMAKITFKKLLCSLKIMMPCLVTNGTHWWSFSEALWNSFSVLGTATPCTMGWNYLLRRNHISLYKSFLQVSN